MRWGAPCITCLAVFVISILRKNVLQVIGRLELGGEGSEGPELAHWKEIQVTNSRLEKLEISQRKHLYDQCQKAWKTMRSNTLKWDAVRSLKRGCSCYHSQKIETGDKLTGVNRPTFVCINIASSIYAVSHMSAGELFTQSIITLVRRYCISLTYTIFLIFLSVLIRLFFLCPLFKIIIICGHWHYHIWPTASNNMNYWSCLAHL